MYHFFLNVQNVVQGVYGDIEVTHWSAYFGFFRLYEQEDDFVGKTNFMGKATLCLRYIYETIFTIVLD
jgi:hypothetical protein